MSSGSQPYTPPQDLFPDPTADANHTGGYHPNRPIIFALAASTSFLLYLHRYTWNLVRPELESEYGLTNTQLESLGSAFFFPYALGQIPAGIVCDLFGPHLFLVLIIPVWSLLLPLLGMTSNFTALLAIRGVFGLAQAGCYPAIAQATRAWFAPNRRTQVQGWVASAFGRGGGAMASIIMGSLLMGHFGMGWIASLWTLSIVGVLFAVLFFFLFRNSPDAVGPLPLSAPASNSTRSSDAEKPSRVANANEPPRILPFGTAMQNRSLAILVFQQFLNAGSDVIFALILGSYFKSLGVAGGGELGILISLPLWGGALGGIFGGYANDWMLHRFQSRRWCRAWVSLIGMGVGGVMVMLAVLSPDPKYAAIGLLIARFFADWNQPTVWGTCTDLGGRYAATVFGINNMSGNLGAFLTPFAVGVLLDRFATESLVDGKLVRQTDYTPAFILCGLMMLVAAISWLWIDCSKAIIPEDDPVSPAVSRS
jgi:ACS family glucarate transporter-like MFS transporter